jgi:hypothetical protein
MWAYIANDMPINKADNDCNKTAGYNDVQII